MNDFIYVHFIYSFKCKSHTKRSVSYLIDSINRAGSDLFSISDETLPLTRFGPDIQLLDCSFPVWPIFTKFHGIKLHRMSSCRIILFVPNLTHLFRVT